MFNFKHPQVRQVCLFARVQYRIFIYIHKGMYICARVCERGRVAELVRGWKEGGRERV